MTDSWIIRMASPQDTDHMIGLLGLLPEFDGSPFQAGKEGLFWHGAAFYSRLGAGKIEKFTSF